MMDERRLDRGARDRDHKSSRGLVPISTYGRLDAPYNAYLDTLDPRGDSDRSRALRQALASSVDPRFQQFFVYLSQGGRKSLAAIAKMCDISLPQFAEFWQKAQHARAIAIAQDGIPSLAADMSFDAATKSDPCSRCDGFGWVYVDNIPRKHVPGALPPMQVMVRKEDKDGNEKIVREDRQIRTCPRCKGTGIERRPGDQHARDKLLEMTGHTGKNAPSVRITQNFGAASMEAATERLNKITFDVGGEETRGE